MLSTIRRSPRRIILLAIVRCWHRTASFKSQPTGWNGRECQERRSTLRQYNFPTGLTRLNNCRATQKSTPSQGVCTPTTGLARCATPSRPKSQKQPNGSGQLIYSNTFKLHQTVRGILAAFQGSGKSQSICTELRQSNEMAPCFWQSFNSICGVVHL